MLYLINLHYFIDYLNLLYKANGITYISSLTLFVHFHLQFLHHLLDTLISNKHYYLKHINLTYYYVFHTNFNLYKYNLLIL